ncbi:DMT family transporter [Diplocloster modestus]|uniref:DMT family transporter n=1 Tax=Diplocloster modestus TaxID=2850322 RepID=A0ABS6K463_9FIRM|nr:DMT family transporter [Diplocloster modestus]MBU9725314.1 DMT family transporter [Diplocloster modestus]
MPEQEKKISIAASFGLLSAAIIWGFAFVIVKSSLDVIPPVYMLAFRFTIASAGLALIFHKKFRALNKKLWEHGAILGLFLFLSYLFQTIGCQYTTAGKNAFLTTIYVVLVPFLHWIFNKKKPDRYCVIAAFMSVAGIGLLSLQGDLTMNIGDVLTLICGFGYAIHIVFIDRYTEMEDPVLLTVLQLGFAAVFSWILAPILDGSFPAGALRPDMIAGMLYLGLLSTMVAFLLQNVGQKYTKPSTAALLLSMESVFGIIFSMIFLGEELTLKMAAGCILIFTAVIMAETKLEFFKRKKTVGGNEYV